MGNNAGPKYWKQIVMLLLLILFLSPRYSYADTYSYDFTGDLSIWDVSGSYTDDAMGCSVVLTMNQDTQGKITGGGNAQCSISGVDINMTYDIKGSIKKQNSTTTVKASIKFSGGASYMGESFKFSASEKITAEIDPASEMMYGTIKVKVSVAGERVSETTSFSETLPDDMDGTFDLIFDVNQAGKGLLGSGNLEISNGETFMFSVKGKTNDKKGESKFSLTGDGCKLKLTIDAIDDHIRSLKGKVLGQKVAQ